MSIRVFVMVSMLRRVRNCRFIITDKQRRKKKLTGWVTDQDRPSQNPARTSDCQFAKRVCCQKLAVPILLFYAVSVAE